MRLGFVVQRYGSQVNGGAELHCRMLAEHLSRIYEVEVFSTRAKDYIYWENSLPSGKSVENDVTVYRYPVSRKRNLHRFHKISQKVFTEPHSTRDELLWIKENGPYSPKLVKALNRASSRIDYFIFYSYRYYPTFFGVRNVAEKAILVPTAENDDAIRLEIFKQFFSIPRGIIYLTPEEKNLVQGISSNTVVPSMILGGGIELPKTIDGDSFRRKYEITGPYVLYIGRIDRNKGCEELFKFFQRYNTRRTKKVKLVCIGNSVMEKMPVDDNIIFLGYLPDEDKHNAISVCDFLIMPSNYESLSIVVLETWGLGKPVLVNGKCDVLKGQCLRANGGLYYHTYSEFAECMNVLLYNPKLRSQLGDAGQRYVERQYNWDLLENKMNLFLKQLATRS